MVIQEFQETLARAQQLAGCAEDGTDGALAQAQLALQDLRGLYARLVEQEQAQVLPDARALSQRVSGLQARAGAVASVTFQRELSADALLEFMGYQEFRPGQRAAVEAALSGRDSLVIMPTGGGKSLCYQLPGLATPDLTVVVSPLIALMTDQCQRLTRDGHPAVMYTTAISDEERAGALAQIRDGTARITFLAPEALTAPRVLNALSSRTVALFAVDEAHLVSEWGHNFRPEYLRLHRTVERLGRPPVMALTATATPQAAEDIRAQLRLSDPIAVRTGFDRPNISFDVIRDGGNGVTARKYARLQAGLRQAENLPAIVYTRTRKDAEDVAETLVGAGISAEPYHGKLGRAQRAETQQRFMSGEIQVIVATNAFGMGVDKDNIRSVWHWALPTSVEAYYQEAGRAGRDGQQARAVLLAGDADLNLLRRFIDQSTATVDTVRSYFNRLQASAGQSGTIVIERPEDDQESIYLAVCERAGAISIEPAPGNSWELSFAGFDDAAVRRLCRSASERLWDAYHRIKDFAQDTEHCRRQQILDHFGDPASPAPTGRCCDLCDPVDWLPSAEELAAALKRAKPARGGGGSAGAPAVTLTEADQPLFDELKVWRRETAQAANVPSYVVFSDRDLAEIARSRPAAAQELLAVRGVGQKKLDLYGPLVLAIVARH